MRNDASAIGKELRIINDLYDDAANGQYKKTDGELFDSMIESLNNRFSAITHPQPEAREEDKFAAMLRIAADNEQCFTLAPDEIEYILSRLAAKSETVRGGTWADIEAEDSPKPETDGDARIALQAIKELSQLIKCDQPRMSVWAKDGAEAVTRMSAILASHGQGERALREALEQAAQSLEAIGRLAGKDEALLENDQVRGYAINRAAAARAALGQSAGGGYMSDEARELFSALSDLADVMSEEWSSKPESETDGIDYEALYSDKAAALIDAALAKVREECAEMARAKARAIRHANTYRGKVNMTAEQSAVFIEDLADDMEHAILGKEITCSKD